MAEGFFDRLFRRKPQSDQPVETKVPPAQVSRDIAEKRGEIKGRLDGVERGLDSLLGKAQTGPEQPS